MRILITGAAGAGTTTLGKAVASKMGWNFIDADDYYWLPTKPPYQAQRDHSSRLEMILDEFDKHENSVVAGSIMNWGSQLEDFFDLIVFLYLDESIRVERLKIREKKELGWASEYDVGPSYGRSLTRHKKWLSERKCKILKLEGDLSVQQRCELLIEALPNKPQKSAI
jgi:adenylate kinase family enzyme